MRHPQPVMQAFLAQRNVHDALAQVPEDVMMLRGILAQLDELISKQQPGLRVMLVIRSRKCAGSDITFHGSKGWTRTRNIVRTPEIDDENPHCSWICATNVVGRLTLVLKNPIRLLGQPSVLYYQP